MNSLRAVCSCVFFSPPSLSPALPLSSSYRSLFIGRVRRGAEQPARLARLPGRAYTQLQNHQTPFNAARVHADQTTATFHNNNNATCGVQTTTRAQQCDQNLSAANAHNVEKQADTSTVRNAKTQAWTVTSRLNRYPVLRKDNKANLTCYAEHPAGNQADSVVLNVLCKYFRPTLLS